MTAPARTPEEFRRILSDVTGTAPLRLRFTANVHSLLSTRRERDGSVKFSVHRSILDASRAVQDAAVSYAKGNPTREARALVRQFFAGLSASLHAAAAPSAGPGAGPVSPAGGSASAHAGARPAFHPPRPRGRVALDTAGRFHDLGPMAAELNSRFFQSSLVFSLTWGNRDHRGLQRQRSVQLGVWLPRQRLVRMHPLLDDPRVPAFVVQYILYHEMVHIEVPPEVDGGGRVCPHTQAFYERERRFPEYARATEWLQRHLSMLLREWNGGPKVRSAQQLHLF